MTAALRSSLRFENTYAERLEGAYAPVALTPAPRPSLVAFNAPLAVELGLDPEAVRDEVLGIVSGASVPDSARVLAMAYAGHQFGHLSPLLGDGRAALIGELIDARGRRRDLHLKGSGRTPFSRGGDGRATLGPVLRELLVAEGMHGLGIPTSRVLAAATTGERVRREEPLPGAVLARVAASHLRVGTFELFAARRDGAMVERLIDYALERHFPERRGAETPALALLEGVAEVQARLIAQWMGVGFVHGVMNTDNFTISGETIDYGPCAFLDAYDPAAVFSSIDRGGRYAYANQPAIGAWNLARFAEALLPHIDPDPEVAASLAIARVEAYMAAVAAHRRAGMNRKIGLPEDADEELVAGLLARMAEARLDYTSTFRQLARGLVSPDAIPEALAGWADGWLAAIDAAGAPRDEVAARMDAENPIYIPRNHKVEEALAAAHDGDYGPFEAMVEVLRDPFTARDVDPSYAEPAPASFGPYTTFCGT